MMPRWHVHHRPGTCVTWELAEPFCCDPSNLKFLAEVEAAPDASQVVPVATPLRNKPEEVVLASTPTEVSGANTSSKSEAPADCSSPNATPNAEPKDMTTTSQQDQKQERATAPQDAAASGESKTSRKASVFSGNQLKHVYVLIKIVDLVMFSMV